MKIYCGVYSLFFKTELKNHSAKCSSIFYKPPMLNILKSKLNLHACISQCMFPVLMLTVYLRYAKKNIVWLCKLQSKCNLLFSEMTVLTSCRL